jgi:hypothetical protein
MASAHSLVRLDGEAPPPEADAELRTMHEALDALRASLRALPDDVAPADVWARVDRRLDRTNARGRQRSRERHRLRKRLRSRKTWIGFAAAAALAVAAVGVFTLLRSGAAPPVSIRSDAHDAAVRRLMAESQRLERDLAPGPRFAVDPGSDRARQWQTSHDAMLYRLADIDDELTAESLAPSADAERMAALWRQRVELMRSLGELERAREWQAYRAVVF